MKCTATTTNGEPCQAPAVTGGERCFWHSDAQALRAASAKGGRRSPGELPDAKPLSPRQARGLLVALLTALLDGAVSAGVAACATKILLAEHTIRIGHELEQRVAALENERELEPWQRH